MGIFELLLIGIGLSMDAFAVSICQGLSMKKLRMDSIFLIAVFFGGFQAFMPFIGWGLGKQFEAYIIPVDHWVAFILLLFIGGKMIYEVTKSKTESFEEECEIKLKIKELLILSIATSIDALAVGVTFAFLKVNIIPAVSLIGVTTFLLSGAGVYIGNIFGSKFKSKAELAGGIILILIGFKILLEHLGILF